MHVRSCRRLRSSTSPNVLIAATVLSIVAAATAPPPHAPIPRDPAALAARLNETDAALEAAIDGWKDLELGRPPRDVTLLALYQQRIYIVLFGRPGLAAAALARLPARRTAQLRARRRRPRPARRDPRRGELSPRRGRAGTVSPRALRLQPVAGVRRRRSPLRAPDARRPARVSRVLRLAGVRPHAARVAPPD